MAPSLSGAPYHRCGCGAQSCRAKERGTLSTSWQLSSVVLAGMFIAAMGGQAGASEVAFAFPGTVHQWHGYKDAAWHTAMVATDAGGFGAQGKLVGGWCCGAWGTAGGAASPAIASAGAHAGESVGPRPEARARESWELEGMAQEQQRAHLNRELMKLQVTHGWCWTEQDKDNLHYLKGYMRPHIAYLQEHEQYRVMVALDLAFFAHQGQYRRSGEAFVTHPLEVARVLADLGMDVHTVVAGLLHDTVEDTRLNFEDVEQLFGTTVRRLVEGETKVSKLTSKAREYTEANFRIAQAAARNSPLEDQPMVVPPANDKQAENLRHLLIAMSRDWRVLVVKLADRLHNMRTIAAMPSHKQQRIARETMDVFVPLAHRLGLWTVKCQLEELSFQVMHPKGYKKIGRLLQERERYTGHTPQRLEMWRQKLETDLMANPDIGPQLQDLRAELHMKPRYGVYRAWQRRWGNFYRVQDVVNFRLIFNLKGLPGTMEHTKEDNEREAAAAHKVLGALHRLLKPVAPPMVKDYISHPKMNGYSALHTTVLLEGFAAEVQICTDWMDRVAEHGMAVQWQAMTEESQLSQPRLPWLRQIQSDMDQGGQPIGQEEQPVGQREQAAQAPAALCPGGLQQPLCVRDNMANSLMKGKHSKIVFTAEGDLLSLPWNATVGDVIPQLVDLRLVKPLGAVVNMKPSGMDDRLRTGDVLGVLTVPRGQVSGLPLRPHRPVISYSRPWPYNLLGDQQAVAGDYIRPKATGVRQPGRRLWRVVSPTADLPPAIYEGPRYKPQYIPLKKRHKLPGEEAGALKPKRAPGAPVLREIDSGIDDEEEQEKALANKWGGERGLRGGPWGLLALLALLPLEVFDALTSKSLAKTATLAHSSPVVYLYSMTPAQVIQLICALCVAEVSWTILNKYLEQPQALERSLAPHSPPRQSPSENQGGQGRQAPPVGPSRRQPDWGQIFTDIWGDTWQGLSKVPAALGLSGKLLSEATQELVRRDNANGRLAIVAMAALSVQYLLQGDNALGQNMNLF